MVTGIFALSGFMTGSIIQIWERIKIGILPLFFARIRAINSL